MNFMMKGEAHIIEPYRYWLTRSPYSVHPTWPQVVFVMLNPSTADATLDDPTIRRCRRFTERFGGESFGVVNLFALRATNPDDLLKHSDPVGPLNDAQTAHFVAHARQVVCAWGAWGERTPLVQARVRKFLEIAHDAQLKCLGTTKSGSPRHPLYLPNTAPLQPWAPRP